MLYFIYGSEREKARAKKDELLSLLRGKRPIAEVFTLDTETFSISRFESLYSSQGLFEQKHIAVLDGLLSDKTAKEAVLEGLDLLAESSSVFLLLEGALDAKTAVQIEKHAAKTYSFGEKKKAEWGNNTNFLIADAFGEKDRKNAWVLFQKAIRAGSSAEEIHGTLFWQVKTILLAKKTKNAEEAGIKPFPYGKAVRFAKNFTEKELEETLSRLLDMYHGVRLYGGELDAEMEKFFLKRGVL
jgi:DNA polymerase III delta subunit